MLGCQQTDTGSQQVHGITCNCKDKNFCNASFKLQPMSIAAIVGVMLATLICNVKC